MPPVAVQRAIIEAWRDAFPKTSRVVLIGSDEGMSMAAQDGQGWRADCLGDMEGFSKTWNTLLKDLATLVSNWVRPKHAQAAAAEFTMESQPTPVQRRAFQLLAQAA